MKEKDKAITSLKKKGYPVRSVCSLLEISPSGFYDRQHRPISPKLQKDEDFKGKILKIFNESGGTYGSPRVKASLERQEEVISRHRVARLMREELLSAKKKKNFVLKLHSIILRIKSQIGFLKLSQAQCQNQTRFGHQI